MKRFLVRETKETITEFEVVAENAEVAIREFQKAIGQDTLRKKKGSYGSRESHIVAKLIEEDFK